MTGFIVHFLICNVLISGMVGILFAIKKLWKRHLTGRAQYNLWFLPLCLMAVPFLPVRSDRIFSFFSLFAGLHQRDLSVSNAAAGNLPGPSPAAGWMDDFAVSVAARTPSLIGAALFAIWVLGILAMLLFVLKSSIRLHRMRKSALPLHNREVQALYEKCLEEMHIKRRIPIYSTAFLKSPAIAGLLAPRIYLPVHLILDCNPDSIRYMLLHELQHYRHRDNISNYLLLLAKIFYWFNPVIQLAGKAMRSDCEIACDAAVLDMLEPSSYREYGHTLINFAEKNSLSSSSVSSSLGGTAKQMEQRILNIAAYHKPSFLKRVRSAALFAAAAVLFAGITPALASHAYTHDAYHWDVSGKEVSYLDLAGYFGQYGGSFVLYDQDADRWSVYNADMAAARVSPDSTYKIYDALFALEEKVITPEESMLTWNRETYPFEAWNRDQTLQSAMASSVNWYFQTLDNTLGRDVLEAYIREIGYGNGTVGSDLSSYWMESSLKISPVEQVELLDALYRNTFGFAPENIQAVKDSMRLSSSSSGTLYGKTGTGQVEGKDINGWFIGFLETSENTYFFATNIQSESSATGSSAAEITFSVLSDLVPGSAPA